MNFRRLIGRLLAVFVIVGLVVAPLVTPAATQRMAAAEMSDMNAISGDMPCCPDGQKGNNCQDCPLVAMCMLTIAEAEPTPANVTRVFFQIRRPSLALDDLIADGHVGSAPYHPPRILT